MTTQITSADAEVQSIADHHQQPANGTDPTLPPLPTFDPDLACKHVYDPETGQYHQEPLTLFDLLYQNDEDDIEMPQGGLHFYWFVLLNELLRTFVLPRGWLVLGDVKIFWRSNLPPRAPDVAIFPSTGLTPLQIPRSYYVGRDGPPPIFAIEITSPTTRNLDLDTKPYEYAAVGVREFLIVDVQTPEPEPWRLLGYRLDTSPFYQPLVPDAESAITFQNVGLRFVPIGRERVDVYDAITGARLLASEEHQARATVAEAARREAEARAEAAEARLADLEARLRALEPQPRQDEAGTNNDEGA
jgi:Uma2 family endonuclease